MPSRGDSRFLGVGRCCLSAESEAWGAIRAGGLADHVIVWTNCFWWLLCAHTSWSDDVRTTHISVFSVLWRWTSDLLLLIIIFLLDVVFYLSWHVLSWGVSSEEALPKILRRASAYSASRWAKDFICWEGRDEDAGFPAVPLFVGRFKIRICCGGAAGSESSWITIAVRTGEPPEPKLDFLRQWKCVRGITLLGKCHNYVKNTLPTFLSAYFASWFIFSLASSLLSISWREGHIYYICITPSKYIICSVALLLTTI